MRELLYEEKGSLESVVPASVIGDINVANTVVQYLK